MMAHGYTITATCDGDGHIGDFHFEGYGQNKKEAFADMRSAGWTWRGHNCWCPKCSKVKSARQANTD